MSSTPRSWAEIHREHTEVIAAIADAGPLLDAIVQTIVDCFRNGHRMYVIGNGGSAADAQHIAGELLGRFKIDRAPLPAVALTTDTSTMTAIGNDLGFDCVFSRQLEGLAQPGDVVWLLTTSGNSPNVTAAAQVARERNVKVIGFAGKTGGELASLCDHEFRSPHALSERIQETHSLAYHYICERVEGAFA